jgi:integrase
MPRPNRDGSPAAAANRRRLTELFVKQATPQARPFSVWDSQVHGLVLRVQPTGHRSWRYFYCCRGRASWFHIGNASAVALVDARKIAIDLAARVARGEDPAADRKADRNTGTFAELAADYVERYAKKKNKSYRQAEKLVARYLLPKWGKLKAADIARKDVRAALDRIAAPVLGNQVLRAASAIFSWAISEDILNTNPCRGIKRQKPKARDRVLLQTEMPLFWRVFADVDPDHATALKLILLTGQRPGEVSNMRHEHVEYVADGAWWHLPGEPSETWPGTKNGKSHRVWLSQAALAVLAELPADDGFVFGSRLYGLDVTMRDICTTLKIENKVTPHDLRRTCGSTITALKFGRQAMDRILNHADHSVGGVYDRHGYTDEDRQIMEAVGTRIMALVEGESDDRVLVPFVARK